MFYLSRSSRKARQSWWSYICILSSWSQLTMKALSGRTQGKNQKHNFLKTFTESFTVEIFKKIAFLFAFDISKFNSANGNSS